MTSRVGMLLSTLWRACGSWLAVGSLAGTLAAGMLALHLCFSVGLAGVAASWAVRLYLAALAVALVAGVAEGIRTRARSRSLISLGLLVCICQLALWYGSRARGVLEVGQGEYQGRWVEIEAGPWAPWSPPGVRLLEAPARAGEPFRFAAAQTEIAIARGHQATLPDGSSMEIVQAALAPSFTLERKDGTTAHQGYLKLSPSTSQPELVRLGLLPHRFYVGLVKRRAEPSGIDSFAALHLWVTRGKLTLLDTELAAGDDAPFEGLSFSWQPGAPWVRVAITRTPGPWAALVGLLLVAAGLAARLRPRQAR